MTAEAGISHDARHEKILADGIVDVATELRLVDAGELALLIRNDQQANIGDLVNSSSELYFKAGTLKYGLMSGCRIGWDTSPVMIFDMEFDHASVSAFFRLMLGRSNAAVELLDLRFQEDDLSPAAKCERLSVAIDEARLRQGRPRPS